VTIEVVRKTRVEPQGILDATLSPSSLDKILKIRSSQVSLRLSYYDMRMFIQLLERFSAQAKAQLKRASQHNVSPLDPGEEEFASGGFLSKVNLPILLPKRIHFKFFYFYRTTDKFTASTTSL
jgi:hypothetical protein